jgi:hypothetical protein
VNARTLAKKTVCKVSGITLNYAAAQLVNFDSIRDMILGTTASDVITIRTERKIERKKGRCDGSGPISADTVTIESELESKVYRVLFHKRRWLDNYDLVPFGYVKDD